MEDTTKELTDAEIRRIDYVREQTLRYVNSLLPKGQRFEADVDVEISVAEAVWDIIKDKVSMTERQFFPYVDRD